MRRAATWHPSDNPGTADDARALLAAHDDWRRLFAANPPDATAVNAWWSQLAASNPGEDVTNGGMNLSRILEANDEGATLEKGRLIADFQHELLSSSPEAASAQQDGMGHSWGLAGITSSEVAGAKYSQVHSLAGAGMPSGWSPSPDSEYFHWGYTDALSIIQGTGAVWDGRIPTRDDTFAAHVYGREGDFTFYLPTGTSPDAVVISPQPPPSVPMTTSPIANHNLIASADAANQSALEDIYREIRK